ncbi:sulfotransferase [Zhihengliuella flava]|uniref:Sulfotransferase n=1 Tax=Zhihengliuella flava TaxID=1285193 RepID=A0A931D6Z9_9MICC|nr:sulfotransferase [Zhihengliuella flava]MBG6083542.1 hypothetical protein [Zhihengliuella flava]
MPKFVIGIGSQRAGSTLLHRILDECTPVMMHPVKELHYFDTLHGIRAPKVLTDFSQRQLDREFARLASAEGPEKIGRRVGCYLNTNWMLYSRPVHEINYHSLFKPFLGREFVGETTPEYMLLSDEQIAEMRSVVGAEARIILVTRHPLERFLSAYKLLKVYGGGEVDKERFSDDLAETLETMPSWIEQQIALNDYVGAEKRFRKHFDNVLVLSYEEMTSNLRHVVAGVAEFIGVEVDLDKAESFSSQRVNSIGETGSVAPDVLEKVRARLGLSSKS